MSAYQVPGLRGVGLNGLDRFSLRSRGLISLRAPSRIQCNAIEPNPSSGSHPPNPQLSSLMKRTSAAALSFLVGASVTASAYAAGFPSFSAPPPVDPPIAAEVRTLPGAPQQIPGITSLTADEQRTISIFERNRESTVYITNVALARDQFTLDVFQIPAGTGSGFVWDSDGHIVTNYHVIRGAAELKVTLVDQSVWPADVVGADPDKDIAVLKVKADAKHLATLKPVSIGQSSNLLVGQRVFAIGTPFGLDHSMTSGIISGVGREIGSGNTGVPIKDVIQVDAAINPGNSGGPLLDSSGRVIGINTAILDPSGRGAYSGVGFALPVDTVRSTVGQILQYGRVIRPSLGISLAPATTLRKLGLEGVLVYEVAKGGPAEKAGIQPTFRDKYGGIVLGDVIVSIDGRRVADIDDLFRVLDDCKVGQTVKVGILRNGDSPTEVKVVLQDRANVFKTSPENKGVVE